MASVHPSSSYISMRGNRFNRFWQPDVADCIFQNDYHQYFILHVPFIMWLWHCSQRMMRSSPLELGKTFTTALSSRAQCKWCGWLPKLLHKNAMHFCPFTLGCSFLKQSHHAMRKPSSHMKGQPTGVVAKSPSCYRDR